MTNTLKTILILAVVALAAVGLWWLINAKAHEPVKGTVVSVDLSGIALDGPAVVTIVTAEDTQEAINVPSFGLMLCAAKDNIADVYALKAGDEVEVNGERGEDGSIVPCTDEDHFLRVTSSALTE